MGKKLKTSVHVHEWLPVDKGEGVYLARTEVFEAGEELPEWAQAHVGDHVYEDEFSDDGSQEAAPGEKPAGNASLEAWQSYAASQGVDVEGKSRDEIRDQFNS
jgi:hypothetical protein